jgi:helicase MOV-10
MSNEDFDKEGGGGWVNNGEARIAVDTAQRILASSLIDEADITITSPFAAQVRLLRTLCRRKSLSNIDIGHCEAFQGLVSRFVILYTTRARERYLERDIESCEGIIKQLRRMNLSLMRAQHGLVVIRNPKLLAVDNN